MILPGYSGTQQTRPVGSTSSLTSSITSPSGNLNRASHQKDCSAVLTGSRKPEAWTDSLGIAIRIAPWRNTEQAPAITAGHWHDITLTALAIDQVVARQFFRVIGPARCCDRVH